MSYAIRKDGQGWRAVNGPDDVAPDEDYSETQPEIEITDQPKTIFAPRDYLARFTMTEYGAARMHSNIAVQWTLDNLIGARFVDLADPTVAAGLDLMVSEGVITPGRRTELLAPEEAA